MVEREDLVPYKVNIIFYNYDSPGNNVVLYMDYGDYKLYTNTQVNEYLASFDFEDVKLEAGCVYAMQCDVTDDGWGREVYENIKTLRKLGSIEYFVNKMYTNFKDILKISL